MIDNELHPLTDALRRVGAEAPPVRLPGDLWRRGRQRRRRRIAGSVVAATAAVLALLVALPLGLRPGGGGTTKPAAPPSGPAVPSTVYQPWPWQARVQESPRGAASMLFSGDGAGLSGVYYQSNVAVVGRDGSYRMLLAELNTFAGTDAMLSPDGSHVAMTWGGGSSLAFGDALPGVHVADLTTGTIRGYPLPFPPPGQGAGYGGFRPVGWSPDGRYLAVDALEVEPGRYPAPDVVLHHLGLLDVASGGYRQLTSFSDHSQATLPVAFSPDGRQIAAYSGGTLWVVDTAEGASRRLAELGARGRLGGAGAWSPDGRIAVLHHDGCVEGCDAAALGARGWRIGYLDPQSGAEVSGPAFDTVTGLTLSILGWQADGDVVVLGYSPPAGAAAAKNLTPELYEFSLATAQVKPRLLALHPGGGQSALITLPDFVTRIDVAHDLVVADRFGGPALQPEAWPPAYWVYFLVPPLLWVSVLLSGLTWLLVRRRRGRRQRPAAAAEHRT